MTDISVFLEFAIVSGILKPARNYYEEGRVSCHRW